MEVWGGVGGWGINQVRKQEAVVRGKWHKRLQSLDKNLSGFQISLEKGIFDVLFIYLERCNQVFLLFVFQAVLCHNCLHTNNGQWMSGTASHQIYHLSCSLEQTDPRQGREMILHISSGRQINLTKGCKFETNIHILRKLRIKI